MQNIINLTTGRLVLIQVLSASIMGFTYQKGANHKNKTGQSDSIELDVPKVLSGLSKKY